MCLIIYLVEYGIPNNHAHLIMRVHRNFHSRAQRITEGVESPPFEGGYIRIPTFVAVVVYFTSKTWFMSTSVSLCSPHIIIFSRAP